MLERVPSHGVEMQICLWLVDGSLPGYSVQVDGLDSCHVCFAARDNSGMNDQKKVSPYTVNGEDTFKS